MITLFRKIRKGLLSENNFSSYFLYAIGEIALVVIGILIALQINQWNAQRVDQKNEAQYLSRLHSDISWDEDIIVENLIAMNRKKEWLDRVQQIFEQKESLNKDSLFYLLERSAIMGTDLREDRRKSTFEEMVTSGQLKIIRDVGLRDKIAQFYSMWGHWYDRVSNHRSDYRLLVFKLGDLEKVLNKELNFKEHEQIVLYDLLEQKGLTNQFELNLTHEKNYATFTIIRMNSLKEMIVDLLSKTKTRK